MHLALMLALLGFAPQEKKDRHVIVISIDGLRPEFYLSDDFDTPTLKAMAREGAHAKAVVPAYPSVTYASHATIVTGVRPARHGIYTNTKFGETGGTPEWYWETKDFQAKTIWQTAREKGFKVAITSWPTSVGAKVDWLVPQRWAAFQGEKTSELLMKHSTPGLIAELGLVLGVPSAEEFSKKENADRFIAGAAAYVFSKYKPHLLYVHLIQADAVQHEYGRDAEETKRAVRKVDQNVARIRRAVEKAGLADRTVLVVVGDHGFSDVQESIAPNTLLAAAGLIDLEGSKVVGWRALGHSSGGSMAVYAKDQASALRAREVLEKASAGYYSIMDRKALDELGFNPRAAFALEARDGVSFSGSARGEFAGHKPGSKGQHGFLPTKPQMATGFLAAGPGIRPGPIERMELVDVAPSVARLLGFEMKDVEGSIVGVSE